MTPNLKHSLSVCNNNAISMVDHDSHFSLISQFWMTCRSVLTRSNFLPLEQAAQRPAPIATRLRPLPILLGLDLLA